MTEAQHREFEELNVRLDDLIEKQKAAYAYASAIDAEIGEALDHMAKLCGLEQPS